jgi:hypothetical protein
MHAPRSRPAARRRLAVEPLEARDVPSTVTGTVFDDANENGVRDPGEAGLAGWTVFSDNDRNGVHEPGGPTAQTDATGTYVLDTTGVAPFYSTAGAPYQFVTVDLQAGAGGRWLNTTRTSAYVPDGAADPVPAFGAVFRPDAAAGVAAAGPERLVNDGTAGVQGLGPVALGSANTPISVSADAAGNYVVAWRTVVPGASDQVFARVFNADGSPRTGDLLVSAEPAPAANVVTELPTVAVSDGGRFVVGWAAAAGPKVRVYAADGTALTGVVVVAAGSSTVANHFADLAVDADGDFVVVYGQSTKSKYWGWGSPAVKA